MRAYFRVAPRFGVSMPWWLAAIAYMLWSAAYLIYAMAMIVIFLAQSVWLGGRWCQREWQRRRPAAEL